MSNIDLDGALRSPGLAFEYYVNCYHCGNSLGITDFEMGQILDQWSDQVPIWKNYVENVADENVYDINEDDYADAMASGKEYGQEKTGYEDNDRDKASQGFGVGGRALVAGASYAAGWIASWGVFGSLIEKIPFLGALIACILDFALAMWSWKAKVNSEQHDAAMKVKEELTNQQEALDDIEDDMANDDEAMRDLVDEKNEIVENANQSMGEDMALYDFNRHIYEYYTQLMRERPLTKSEQALYNSAFQYMQQAGNSIGQTRGETQETVDGIQDDIGGYEDNFDYAMSGMGEVEGFTDYAAGFDEKTRTLCKVQAAIFFLAMVKSGVDAVVCICQLGNNFITMAAAAIGATMAGDAALKDYKLGAEQLAWADDIEGEIFDRKETEGMNEETHKSFEDYYDYFGGYMGNRVDMVVPDVEQRLPEER